MTKMTNLPYHGATSEQLQNPFVRELLAIHNMFRDQLVAMLGFVNELKTSKQPLTHAKNLPHIQILVRAGARYTEMLHGHHQLETALLFPSLSAEGLPASVIDQLNAEHDGISILIDKFSAEIADPARIEPEVINHDLQRLSEALQAHLAYEETHVCPLLARRLDWWSPL